MARRKIKEFYVINENFNGREFEPYNVMGYFVDCYKETKKSERPVTFDEFKEFIKRKSTYMFWCKCEYEIVLKPWVGLTAERKIDVHWQIMMNIDIVTEILMDNVLPLKKSKKENGSSKTE